MSEQTLTQEILGILKDVSEEDAGRYDGRELIEALEAIAALENPVYLAIPWCIHDFVLDEFGQVQLSIGYDYLGRKLEASRAEMPMRKSRPDVLAILAWIPLKRDNPELSLDEVTAMLNDGNLGPLTRKIYYFWGVDLDAMDARAEEIRKRIEDGATELDEIITDKVEEEEAEEAGNFTEEQ